MRRERIGLAASLCVCLCHLVLGVRAALGQGSDAGAPRSGAPARREARCPEGGCAEGGGGTGEARPTDPTALARGHENHQRRQERAARAHSRDAPRGAGGGQPGRVEGDDPRRGDPPDRGDPEAPGAVGECHHGPARAEGVEATNPALELEIVDRPFFEVLDVVCKADVTPYFSTGDGTIGLMAGSRPQRLWSSTPGRSGSRSSRSPRSATSRPAWPAPTRSSRWRGSRAPPDAPGAEGRRDGDRRRSGQEGRAPGHEGVDRRRAPAREPGRRDQRQPRRPGPCGEDAGVA